MKSRLRPLELAVLSTTGLLLLGASLATLGAFDDALHWDIFSPRVESVLRGVFAAAMVLASFGVAISMVLGIRAIASAMRALAAAVDPERPRTRDVPLRAYLRPVWIGAAMMVLTVAGLSIVDHRVRSHRDEVFGQLVGEQMERFGPRIAEHSGDLTLEPGVDPPEAPVLAELIDSLEALPYVDAVELMMTRPGEDPIVWTLRVDRDRTWRQDVRFAVREREQAVVQALAGDPSRLERLDEAERFATFSVVRDAQGQAQAVVFVQADPRRNFHELLP